MMNELQDFLSPTSERCIPGICNRKSCNFLQQQVKPMQGNSLTNQILFPRLWIIPCTARRQNQTPFVILLFRITSCAGEASIGRPGNFVYGDQLYKMIWTGVTLVFLSYFNCSGRNCCYSHFIIFYFICFFSIYALIALLTCLFIHLYLFVYLYYSFLYTVQPLSLFSMKSHGCFG